ncbi:Dynactin-associated protein [Plecturocebus cupreus]
MFINTFTSDSNAQLISVSCFNCFMVADIKGNEQIEKYSWIEACDIGSSRMDRKHGTYVLNVERSVNQLNSFILVIQCHGFLGFLITSTLPLQPITHPDDQEAHSSIRWCPPSNDITSDVSPNLTGVCVSPGVSAPSRCLQSESCNTQVKEHCHSDWSMWKVFLACLLACVIMTAIGVLIICLVNNKGSTNSSIVIQLSKSNGTPSTACPPTMTTTSTVPTMTTTSTVPTTTEATTSTATTTTTSTRPTTPTVST